MQAWSTARKRTIETVALLERACGVCDYEVSIARLWGCRLHNGERTDGAINGLWGTAQWCRHTRREWNAQPNNA